MKTTNIKMKVFTIASMLMSLMGVIAGIRATLL